MLSQASFSLCNVDVSPGKYCKRQKDEKMVAPEQWVNISSLHNLAFSDDKSVVRTPNPKEACLKHSFRSVQRVRDLLYKKSQNAHGNGTCRLVHTFRKRVGGGLWPISDLIFSQDRVSILACVSTVCRGSLFVFLSKTEI